MKKLLIGAIATAAVLGLSTSALANGDSFDYSMPAAAPAAAHSFTPGIYMGLQAGVGDTHWNHLYGKIAKKHAGFAGRIFLGYDITKYFAVEAGYTHFFTKTKLDIDADTKGKIKEYAADLMGKMKVPLANDFGLYAKAGLGYLHSATTVRETGMPSVKAHANAYNIAYGLGASYNITPNVITDLSWTRYNGRAKLGKHYLPYADFYALGIAYKFDMS